MSKYAYLKKSDPELYQLEYEESLKLLGRESNNHNQKTNQVNNATEINIKFCRKCGNKLIEGSLFCNKCGTKIDTEK